MCRGPGATERGLEHSREVVLSIFSQISGGTQGGASSSGARCQDRLIINFSYYY